MRGVSRRTASPPPAPLTLLSKENKNIRKINTEITF